MRRHAVKAYRTDKREVMKNGLRAFLHRCLLSLRKGEMRKSINQRFSHNRIVPQASQFWIYRRTESIQSAVPPALKCLRSVNKP